MKVLLSGFIFLLICASLSAQTDTVAYKIEKYEVRKTEKVSAFALKRKIDPLLIVKMNRFKSINSYVVKGQRIKIPVYPKEPKQARQPKPSKQSKQPKQKAEVKKVPPAPPKNKPTPPDTIKSIPPHADNNFDVEKDRVRLLMIEATLELDEALMEGVKASLDSMNVNDENTSNAKDSVSKLRNEKLARDRDLILPFIKHIRDSLEQDIDLLRSEKKIIESRINPAMITNDTVVTGTDTIVYQVKTYAGNRPQEKTVLLIKEKAKAETKRVETKHEEPKTPEKEPGPAPVSKTEIKTPEPRDTVRVINPVKRDSSVTLTVKLPDSKDSILIKPVFKPTASSNPKSKIQNPKSNPSLSTADSIKRIKAEFFLNRAQKALNEKNFSDAKQYLEKSVELYPKYFDAWFAKAEYEEKFGSQQQALKDYQVCESIDSTQPSLYYNIGTLHAKLKHKTEALDAYAKTISLKPDDIPALMGRALIFSDSKKYDSALADYNSVLQIDRTYHYAYKARGQVKLQTKDFASAADDFTRFLLFEETDPSAFFYRGLAKISNNELLDGCLDLSTASGMGYTAAEKAIKRSCE